MNMLSRPPSRLWRLPCDLCQAVPSLARRVALTGVVVLAGLSLPEMGFAAPTAPPASSASASSAVPSAPSAPTDGSDLTVSVDAGVIEALRGETPVWQHVVARSGKGSPALGSSPSPVRSGDVVHYCVEGQLYRTRVADGVVIERWALPGRCTALAATGSGVAVTCAGGDSTQKWTSTVSVEPSKELSAYFLSAGTISFQLRRQANLLSSRGVIPVTQSPDDHRAALQRPEVSAAVRDVLPELEALSKQDVTNPWYDLHRALAYAALGQQPEALSAAREALAHDKRYDIELLAMAAWLDGLDPALGDEAFRRGVTFLIERNYEPEMSTSLLGMTMTIGTANGGKPTTLEHSREKLERFANRLADLSPGVEGSTYFFAALAADAEKRGDAANASRWRALEAGAKPTTQFGGPLPPAMSNGGTWLHLVYSILLGLAAISLVKLIRTLPGSWSPSVGKAVRFNPIARWTTSERIGVLLGVGALVAVARQVSLLVAVIGAIASMPVTLVGGNLSHPEVGAYIDAKLGDAPQAQLFRAFAAQQAGDLAKAKRLYEAAPQSAEVLSNLGVIHAAEGDKSGAEQLWQKALSMRPSLDAAAYNLGKDGGPRGERMKRLHIARPMLALPNAEQWGALWEASVRKADPRVLSSPFTFIPAVFDITPAFDGPAGVSFALSLVFGVTVLALVGLFTRGRSPEPVPHKASIVGWAAALIVPGAARQYGLFGPAVATVAIFAAFGAYTLSSTAGVAFNVLDALAMPSLGPYFGVVQNQVVSAANGFVTLCKAWWVIWLANAAFVLVAQRIWPDPAGPSFGAKPTI